MCLHKIIRHYKQPVSRITYARLMIVITRSTVSIMTPFQKYWITVDRLHHSNKGWIYTGSGEVYPAGFHRWKEPQDVPLRIIMTRPGELSLDLLIKGESGEIETLGLDNGHETYVGRTWKTTQYNLDHAARDNFDCDFDKMVERFRGAL